MCLHILYSFNENSPELTTDLEVLNALYVIGSTENEAYYYRSVNDWYDVKDKTKWLEKYKKSSDIQSILKDNNEWAMAHGFTFTPCVFINGFRYPDPYDHEDLLFFVEELLEDQSLHIYSKENLKIEVIE